MKVKTVSYQKVFPLGMYINERIGVECEVNEMENPATILQEAKLMVEKFHKDSNPQLYVEDVVYPKWDNNLVPPPYQPSISSANTEAIYDKSNGVIGFAKKDPKQEASQRMIEAINSCTELKVLESFKLLVKNNPDFQKAYDEKLKSFNI